MNKNEVYAYYRETLDDIKASGVDTMIKDLQAQVDEWWAANKQ